LAAPIVTIGRNEGERLRRCLVAALRQSSAVVYVDSESTDGSPMLARSLGVHVLELDSDSPHTAARARNAGFDYLLGRNPNLDAVQFIDSDCELAEGWLSIAEAEMARRPEVGAVCGRRRERFLDASIFTRLCDLEWDAPMGDVEHFGGDVLIRVAAFRDTGGFNPRLLAGEDPELSVRVRQHGWTIVRLPAEMTLHDSNMTRFAQWWRRAFRAGHGYAEGYWMHGRGPEHHWLHETLSIWAWGVLLPVCALSAAWFRPVVSLVIPAAYPALLLKIYVRMRRIGRPRRDALLYAGFCVLGKFPQALGQIRFYVDRWLGRGAGRIDYKSA
jgi:GT2 family glycosyltransferase